MASCNCGSCVVDAAVRAVADKQQQVGHGLVDLLDAVEKRCHILFAIAVQDDSFLHSFQRLFYFVPVCELLAYGGHDGFLQLRFL